MHERHKSLGMRLAQLLLCFEVLGLRINQLVPLHVDMCRLPQFWKERGGRQFQKEMQWLVGV